MVWTQWQGKKSEGTVHFIIYLFIYFNWRLITLQYCGGFCHTFTWIIHGCTCAPHPDPPSHLPPHLKAIVCYLRSHFSHVQLFATLWTVACQAPLSMGFSRQDYLSGLPCLPPGDLPNQGIKSMSHYVSWFSRQVLYHLCHLGSPQRILEWVAIPSSRGSSQPRDQTLVSSIAGRFWATRNHTE